jgi:hypothetical protein
VGRVKQRVLLNLGRRDQVVASGELDGLVQSLARFSERLRAIDAAGPDGLRAREARLWGPPAVFGRLWERQGLPELLASLSQGRRFEFDVERCCFAMALQRLCAPGSDLRGSSWVQTVEAPGLDRLRLQHFYRTCAFLHDVRSDLERSLFLRDRDLFSDTLDLVFIDTTSTFVYRDTETDLRKRGYSRDRRGDLPQFVICVAVDRHGWPIAWEVFPGNTADRAAMHRVIGVLQERFRVGRVVVVADRGMIGKDTIALLESDEKAPFDFILGCRMRKQREVSEEVLSRAGRYKVVADNLEVKEVRVDGRRYVVCRNPEEAKKDAGAREAIVARLEQEIASRPKSIVKNRGFARFLRMERGALSIDRAAVEADARLDGKFVLRTNTEIPTEDVALTYKGLWRVERAFRETKSTLEVRPIFHHRDDTSVGHIVASFLALRLEVDLQRRLDARKAEVSWPDLMGDLAQVQAVAVELDGKRYRLRTDLKGSAHHAFAAAGVRPPPIVERIGAAAAGPDGGDETQGEEDVVPSGISKSASP